MASPGGIGTTPLAMNLGGTAEGVPDAVIGGRLIACLRGVKFVFTYRV